MAVESGIDLESLGLRGNDANTYSSLLSLKDATAYEISKKTGIHRGNVYDSLNRLVEKGLVSYVIKNKVKHYEAAEPTRLLELLKEKELVLQKIIEDLREKEKPTVQVKIFEGKKGLALVYQDIINTGEDYYALGATGKIYETLESTYESFMRKRKEKKMRLYAIFDQNAKKQKVFQFKGMISRFMPPGYISPINTTIYRNKVAMYIWTDEPNSPIVILIESPIVAQAFKNYFDLVWSIAEK